MSLRSITPCDCDGGCCPYDAQSMSDCEYWCGSEEPEDNPGHEEDDDYYVEYYSERNWETKP